MDPIGAVIGFFSPKAAARRRGWRIKHQALVRLERDLEKRFSGNGYAGASRDRRTTGWSTSVSGTADSVIRAGGQIMRDRAHDLVRNNPHAANLVSKHADNIIGDGITPKAKTGDKVRDAEIDALFEKFSNDIDPEGLLNFYGKQHQAVRIMVESGEVLARRRNRRLSDGLPVPLQVQLYEPEFLDATRNVPFAPNSQNYVRDGIEYNVIGGRRGYWMFRQHPQSQTFATNFGRESVFVPAEDVAHLFEVKRDQSRGETWLSPVMVRLQDHEDYDAAERLRKKAEACLVAVVTDSEDDPDGDDPEQFALAPRRGDRAEFDENDEEVEGEEPDWPLTNPDGDVVERMEPGAVYHARAGSDVKFNTPSSSAGYDTYNRAALKAVAAGGRMPYEVLTGDLSEVSYASGRMGRTDYQRFVRSVQWNFVVPMFCQPIWDWFIDTLRIIGEIPDDLAVDVEWTVPAFQSITPIDDANADLAEVRAGFKSWDEAVTARGMDPDKTAQAIADRNKFWDANGIVLDSDPRRLSKNGQTNQPVAASGQGAEDVEGEQAREAAEFAGSRRTALRRAGRTQAAWV